MLIERAARALTRSESGHDDFEYLDFCLQEELRENVRAVMEAILDPTPVMIDAGATTLCSCSAEDNPSEVSTRVWQAMLGAALAQTRKDIPH
ncbi:hypothetical protein QUC32_27430 (plasmid) [Novosphingobium resinovorum]|jgi:GTP cyclohydrolase I|uniref:hypothetical protein n=1 Tax=Sphingomonadaceae TaxID=41297 RepID=UPI00027CB8E5|nr:MULTISPECIES: hypothetical protein [Sphingomonadaceae]EJU12047.1 hypothetical protein LH128_15776 [Sphingomonas sp. LH128]MBF7015433.1 hypothetical protein [Novosphingobium sp. HR1a]WJM30113.1 hypothetical protein QUC32_27430 [Novosphingobium resinovorum]